MTALLNVREIADAVDARLDTVHVIDFLNRPVWPRPGGFSDEPGISLEVSDTEVTVFYRRRWMFALDAERVPMALAVGLVEAAVKFQVDEELK